MKLTNTIMKKDNYKKLSGKEMREIFAFIDRWFTWDYRSKTYCCFKNYDSNILIMVHNGMWATLKIKKGDVEVYRKTVTSFADINEFKRLIKMIG